MGCLSELIFGMAFEIVGEAVCTLYIKLMTFFVPKHQFAPSLHNRVQKGVYVFAEILFVSALGGSLILLKWSDFHVVTVIGAWMFFIPLGITVILILIGIIDRIIRSKRRRR